MLSTTFSFQVGKKSIIWRTGNFHPGLKFHLGLAKPSWNFNALYRVEIFICNCNAILKTSFLFSRDEISTQEYRVEISVRVENAHVISPLIYSNPPTITILKTDSIAIVSCACCKYYQNRWERASGGSLFVILHYAIQPSTLTPALICSKIKVFDKFWELPF